MSGIEAVTNENAARDAAATATEQILYEDDKIQITEKQITLKMFYFPLGLSKTIPISTIQSFKAYRPRSFLQMKGWGMGTDFNVWWHCDLRRQFGDRHAIVLKLRDSWPHVGLTPGSGDPSKTERVLNVLRELQSRHPQLAAAAAAAAEDEQKT